MKASQVDKKGTVCIKCGRDTLVGQVFCPDCLADMATAPVAPDTPVLLPPPVSVASIRRQPTRKVKKPEEQIRSLRIAIVWLSAVLAALTLAFTVTTAILVSKLNDQQPAVRPGENYSTNEDLTNIP
jgi:hypothetical protein